MLPRVSAAHQAAFEPTLIDSGGNMGYWQMHFNQTRVQRFDGKDQNAARWLKDIHDAFVDDRMLGAQWINS